MKTRLFPALLLILSAIPAGAETRVKLATWAPRGSSYHQMLLAMGEKWRQAPGGGASLAVYPDGTMGSEADIVRKMRVGQLQAGLLTVVGLSEIDPSVSALQNLPLMFRSLDEVDHVRKSLAPELEKRLLEKGFVMLAWSDLGWVRIFSTEPVVSPQDLARLKLFVTASDSNQVEILKAMGYHPVPLEWNDILPGLQTGLIEAAFLHPFFALTSQTYTAAPHMLTIDFAPLVGGLVVSKKAWDAVPDAAHPSLAEAAAALGGEIRRRGRAENEESVVAMTKRGLTVHALTAGAEAEWRKLAESVYPKIRGQMVPADTFDEVERLLREFRAPGGGAGRP
jgi:TRAP-type C4-dicarboxylate transport system substrate-binding protein